MRDAVIEALAMVMYTTYCEKVGGLAFNGDPLPSADEFFNDDSKQKQADAWRAAAVSSRDYFKKIEFEQEGHAFSDLPKPVGSFGIKSRDTAISDLRLLRVRIDQINVSVPRLGASREASTARTALDEAFMFIGLSLKNLGAAYPYPNGIDSSTSKVDPGTDKADSDFLDPNLSDDKIIASKQLREKIEDIIKEGVALVDTLAEGGELSNDVFEDFFLAKTKLKAARMWLGAHMATLSK